MSADTDRTGRPRLLRAEHRAPFGIGVRQPRLSWRLPEGASRQDA